MWFNSTIPAKPYQFYPKVFDKLSKCVEAAPKKGLVEHEVLATLFLQKSIIYGLFSEANFGLVRKKYYKKLLTYL